MAKKAQALLAALVLLTGLFGIAMNDVASARSGSNKNSSAAGSNKKQIAEDCATNCGRAVDSGTREKQLPSSGGGNGSGSSGGSSGQSHLINTPTQNKPLTPTVNPTLQGNALQKSNGLLTKPVGGYDLKANKGR